MLSRASALPRVCLSCRLSLSGHGAARRFDAMPQYTARLIRRYSSEHASDSAATYEAKLMKLVSDEYYHDFLIKKDLDLKSLGRPVSALIIKNPNEMRSRPMPLPELDEEAPSTGTPLRVDDVLTMEEDSGSDSLEEVMKNLDELRPSGTDALKLRQMEKLVGALDDGFTWQQLKSYCATRNQKPRSWAKDANPYSWIVQHKPWEAVRMVQLEKLTPKRQLAAKIITGVWDVGVREQVNGPGSMLVWLRPSVFELLFRPSSQLLQSLTAECLGKSKKWKITPSVRDSRLEIYSPKATARAVLARIDNMVQAIKTRTITVEKKDMSRTVLDELERVTNTSLRYKANGLELSISWVADDSLWPSSEPRAQELSASQRTDGPADVVLRLLLAQQANPQPTKMDIIPSLEREQPADATLVGHHCGNRALPWNDKMRQWSRRVNPASRKDSATAPSRISLVDKLSLPSPAFKTKEGLSTNRITATFGHVLHAGPTHYSHSNKRRRVLSPVVPHPASFSSVGVGSDKPVVESTAIILNFSPERAPGSHKGKGLPPLQLKLPVGPDSDLTNFTFPLGSILEGVLAPWYMKDLLLPDELVDVRLVQQRVLSLDADQPSLKEFLAASEFNLLEGRLRTPSHAHFSVPNNWLAGKPRSAKPTKSKPDEPSASDAPTRVSKPAEPLAQGTTDVPYLFVGLEIHQMVDLEFDGYTLRYNSIEAGHQGGQRQEITLLAVSDSRSEKPEAAGWAKKFLQAVEDVAFGNLFSWHKGNKMMQDHRYVQDPDWETADGAADAHRAMMQQQMSAGGAEPPILEDAHPLESRPGASDARGAAMETHTPLKRKVGAALSPEPGSEEHAPSSGKPAAARVEDPDWVTQLRSMVRKD